MNRLNRHNYNKLMFDLLENNIRGEERTSLLREIEADDFYKEQWQQWQQTLVEDQAGTDNNEYEEFLESLTIQEEEKKRFMVPHRWLSAASILLVFGLLMILTMKRPGSTRGLRDLTPDLSFIPGQGIHKDTEGVAANQNNENVSRPSANKSGLRKAQSDKNQTKFEDDQEPDDHLDTPEPEEIQPVEEIVIREPEPAPVPNQKILVSVGTIASQDPAKKKLTMSGLLTNTKIRFKKHKDAPQIELKGDSSSVVLSLSK